MNTPTIVWDGDQTIWNWLEYAVPAYEAMCKEIAQYSGRDFDQVAAAMKVFYTRKNTLEDEGLIQGLEEDGFFDHAPNYDRDHIIEIAQSTFKRVRSENLHVYPGIAKAIRESHERGWRQIIISDAPAVQAAIRLDHSRLGKYIDEVHTMPAAVVPHLSPRRKRPDIMQREQPRFRLLTKEKPDIDLEAIVQMTRAEIIQYLKFIGDNDNKDMATARAYGCSGLHAQYGEAHSDQLTSINRFAPERVARRNMQTTVPQQQISDTRIQIVRDSREIAEILGKWNPSR